jgi:hypothetical protein
MSELNVELNIDESLAICEAATGPLWHVMDEGFSNSRKTPTVYECNHNALRYIAHCADFMSDPPTDNLANATFIAHAREHFPAALRKLQAAEAKLAAIEKTVDEFDRLAESHIAGTCKSCLMSVVAELRQLLQPTEDANRDLRT